MVGVVGRAKLQRHLVFGAQVDFLDVTTAAQVPEVDFVAVVVVHDMFQDRAVLEHIGGAPFAGHDHVQTDVPPEVVGEQLGAAVELPAAQRFESVVVDAQYAAGRSAIGRPNAVQVDGVGAAMHGMKAAVAGAGEDVLRLNSLDELEVIGIGLGVHDVDA